MHEAGIAQGVLDAAMAALPKGGKIVRIVVAAGVLAGVEKECLSMYFTELAKGTPAEGAELELRKQPARLVCRECGAAEEFDGSGPVTVCCAKCGGNNSLEGTGSDIMLESMEVLTDED